MHVFLLRMLSAALRRDICHRAFENLQQRLLHAFAGDIARYGWVIRLARDLIDLVDVDDPALGILYGILDVVARVRGLQKFEQDVFHVFADISRLGQRCRIGYRERHIQNLRQRLCQQCLAGACRPDKQNIGLLQFNIRHCGVDALEMIVHRDRERSLGCILADHILAENAIYLFGFGYGPARRNSLPPGLPRP